MGGSLTKQSQRSKTVKQVCCGFIGSSKKQQSTIERNMDKKAHRRCDEVMDKNVASADPHLSLAWLFPQLKHWQPIAESALLTLLLLIWCFLQPSSSYFASCLVLSPAALELSQSLKMLFFFICFLSGSLPGSIYSESPTALIFLENVLYQTQLEVTNRAQLCSQSLTWLHFNMYA